MQAPAIKIKICFDLMNSRILVYSLLLNTEEGDLGVKL